MPFFLVRLARLCGMEHRLCPGKQREGPLLCSSSSLQQYQPAHAKNVRDVVKMRAKDRMRVDSLPLSLYSNEH